MAKKPAAKKTATVTFTDEEKKALQRAALAVWEECGYDVLQAVAEDQGKDINAVTVSRAEAIEIALDAGRPEDRLRASVGAARRAKHDAEADLLFALLEKMKTADYDTLIAAVKPAFPHARYGM